MYALDVSMRAASLVGDATRIPREISVSVRGVSSTGSGPMKARSTPFLNANSRIAEWSSSSVIRVSVDREIIEGFLFFRAEKSWDPDSTILLATASSLPPPPTSRILLGIFLTLGLPDP